MDVEPDTENIDPALIAKAITPRIRAIMPVHYAERPCRMDEIERLAHQHGLLLIEDAAHAVDAAYHGRKVGTIGNLTCFSFYATKNVTTAEGGMITTAPSWPRRSRCTRSTGSAWTRGADFLVPLDFLSSSANCFAYKPVVGPAP